MAIIIFESNNIWMKTLVLISALCASLSSSAQYYYKDIIGTKESADLIKTYRANNVRTVTLNSYTINNTPIDNFSVRQEFLPQQSALRTTTKTDYTYASYLTSYVDAAGRVIKTTDSSNGIVNLTTYAYNASGKLTGVFFKAGDTSTAVKTDDHLWQYDAKGNVKKMLRIKNKMDTAIVWFDLDAQGNVGEEQEQKRVSVEEAYHYYYDADNRLTDIVRYNKKAKRLLPESIFYYDENNRVIQRYSIPPNSDDYLIWRFVYDAKGLKTKEGIYNKQKEQTGKIEYVYSFGN